MQWTLDLISHYHASRKITVSMWTISLHRIKLIIYLTDYYLFVIDYDLNWKLRSLKIYPCNGNPTFIAHQIC